MARIKKPVIVVPALHVDVADKVMSLALMSGHVSESIFGVCPETSVGSNLLKARESLKDGFTVAFFSHLRPLAKGIEKESPDVQALYLDILKSINAEKPELVSVEAVRVMKNDGERMLNTTVYNLKK
jgi:hypothetical protein